MQGLRMQCDPNLRMQNAMESDWWIAGVLGVILALAILLPPVLAERLRSARGAEVGPQE